MTLKAETQRHHLDFAQTHAMNFLLLSIYRRCLLPMYYLYKPLWPNGYDTSLLSWRPGFESQWRAFLFFSKFFGLWQRTVLLYHVISPVCVCNFYPFLHRNVNTPLIGNYPQPTGCSNLVCLFVYMFVYLFVYMFAYLFTNTRREQPVGCG